MDIKRITSLSLFLAIAIVLSIVESFIPSIGIPGARLGLANIVTLVIMYIYGERDAFMVLVMRIFIVGLLRTGLLSPGFALSLSGGMLAFILMFTFKKINKFSKVSVSVMGSLGHSLGQIIMAIIILSTNELVFYFPLLFLIAVPTGLFVGFTADRFIKIWNQSNEIYE